MTASACTLIISFVAASTTLGLIDEGASRGEPSVEVDVLRRFSMPALFSDPLPPNEPKRRVVRLEALSAMRERVALASAGLAVPGRGTRPSESMRSAL